MKRRAFDTARGLAMGVRAALRKQGFNVVKSSSIKFKYQCVRGIHVQMNALYKLDDTYTYAVRIDPVNHHGTGGVDLERLKQELTNLHFKYRTDPHSPDTLYLLIQDHKLKS